MFPPTVFLGAKNMNVTRSRSLAWWQLVLALGAILLSGPAPAQDACSLQCSAKEAAWCDGTEFICPFGYQTCMQQCEGTPPPNPVPIPHPPACMIAQNAMRPCTSQTESYVPRGVDRGLVGTWEIVAPTPVGTVRWVWEIHKNGTYSFHAEGPGAAPAHSGTFAASKGHYVLNSTTMAWNDTGTYQLTDSATLIATGRLGTGTWRRVQSKLTGHPRSTPITVRK